MCILIVSFIRIAKDLNKSEPGSSRNPNDQGSKRNSRANTTHIAPQHSEGVPNIRMLFTDPAFKPGEAP